MEFKKIKIKKKKENYFKVIVGDKYADKLGYDEMIGLVALLAAPEKPPQLNWLRTKSEHKKHMKRVTDTDMIF